MCELGKLLSQDPLDEWHVDRNLIAVQPLQSDPPSGQLCESASPTDGPDAGRVTGSGVCFRDHPDGALRGSPDAHYTIRLEFGDLTHQVADAMACDDLADHLSNPPRTVGQARTEPARVVWDPLPTAGHGHPRRATSRPAREEPHPQADGQQPGRRGSR